MIKERNPVFEQEGPVNNNNKKEKFNPVRILGNLLKELSNKKRKKDVDDAISIGGGSKMARSRRAPSSKIKKVDSPRKSNAVLQKIEEGEELEEGKLNM